MNILPTQSETSEEKKVVTKPLTDIDKKRIRALEEKRSQSTPSFCFKLKEGSENAVVRDESASCATKHQADNGTYFAATGSINSSFVSSLLSLAINAAPVSPGNNTADEANALMATLLSLKPQDEIESMMITRLVVLHKNSMNIMAKAWQTDRVDFASSYTNSATKLMRCYNETLETLNRYRRKGEQKITVQHVNVSDGGQAIVSGNTTTIGGSTKKTEEVLHEKKV